MDDFNLFSFVFDIKNTIKHFINLEVLIFKNWKWNEITYFRIYNNNLKKIELINNTISVDEFWNICNLNIINLKNCNIYEGVMKKVTLDFHVKLRKNSNGKYSTINSTC